MGAETSSNDRKAWKLEKIKSKFYTDANIENAVVFIAKIEILYLIFQSSEVFFLFLFLNKQKSFIT